MHGDSDTEITAVESVKKQEGVPLRLASSSLSHICAALCHPEVGVPETDIPKKQGPATKAPLSCYRIIPLMPSFPSALICVFLQ